MWFSLVGDVVGRSFVRVVMALCVALGAGCGGEERDIGDSRDVGDSGDAAAVDTSAGDVASDADGDAEPDAAPEVDTASDVADSTAVEDLAPADADTAQAVDVAADTVEPDAARDTAEPDLAPEVAVEVVDISEPDGTPDATDSDSAIEDASSDVTAASDAVEVDSDDAPDDSGASDDTESATPEDTEPEVADTAPVDTTVAVVDTAILDTTPADTTPADTAILDTTPADTTPADTTPADTTPADTTPADTTPADTEPADTTEPVDTEPDTDTTVAHAPTVGAVFVYGDSTCRDWICEAILVADADGDPVTLAYRWYIDGVLLPGATGPSLSPAAALVSGAEVRCGVSPSDGTLVGAEVRSPPAIARDFPPVITSVALTTHARAGDLARCSASASDDCSASPDVTLSWTLNGVPVPDQHAATFTTSALATGDVLTCSATASDGVSTTSASSSPLAIAASQLVITASLPNGLAGYAVAVIDDIDGDQLAELAIGAPNTSPEAAPQAGALYLVYGREDADAIDLAELVDPAGDPTIGRYYPGDRGGFDVKLMACGPAFYVGGCPKLREVGEMTADIEGPQGAGLGFGLGYAGDLDGDGVGDLVASAPYELIGDLWRGHTYVMSGTSLEGTPLSDAALGAGGFVFDGECGRRRGLDLKIPSESVSKGANGDLSGYRVAGIGDMNGDGLGDYAVAAPNHGDRDEGTVYVVFGRTDRIGVTGTDLFQRGCGVDEIAVPGVASGSAGFAAYGPNLPRANAFPIRWGKLLAPAGDFNGDGYDDLLVPSPGFGADSNSAYVVLGGPQRDAIALTGHDLAKLWEIYLGDFEFVNGQTRGRIGLGFPSGGGGDVNGDGFDDLAFAAIDFDRRTFMNVIYGRPSDDDAVLRTEESVAATWGAGLGFAVSGSVDMSSENGVMRIVGDLNGDGFDDVAFGSPTHGSPDVGGVFVVFGAATPPVGLTLANLRAGVGGFTIEGTTAGSQLGWSLDGGDIDGDGLDDLVIGVPKAAGSGGEVGAGKVIVSYGRDLSGAIARYGGPGNDVLIGTAAGESIVGGRGNDVLVGGGGADVLYGGAGDDVIEVASASFRRVRGGAGDDTLVLGAGVAAFDLTSARGRVRDVERLRLNGQTLTLSRREIVRSSETDNRLVVTGTGTVTTAIGDRWRDTGIVTNAGRTFITLVDGQGELWLDAALATVIPPTVLETTLTVPEGSAQDAVVATLGAVDPDGPESALRWVLLDDPSGVFALEPATGRLRVVDPLPLDFETAAFPWTLEVLVTDEDGLQTEGAFEVAVGDVDEPPRFPVRAPRWTVEEDIEGVVGSAAAIDEDVDDVVHYALHGVPGPFAIDGATGVVSLRAGQSLDYETATQHVITVAAIDRAGNTDEVDVTIDVMDREVLERHARINFEVRDWSIWQDGDAADFQGLQIDGFDDDQIVSACLSQSLGDETLSEKWSTRIPGSAGVPFTLPISFDARFTGDVCTRNSLVYDEGTWNATVPVDIALTVPDEIHAGDTITIGSTATPTGEGAGLWGTTTGIEMQWGVEFDDFSIYMAVCDDLVTHRCRTVVDKQHITGTYRDSWRRKSKTWTAGQVVDPDGGFVLGLTEMVRADHSKLLVDWDAYLYQALSYLGLPSNTGRLDTVLQTGTAGDITIRFDYTMLQTEVGFEADSAWAFWLEFNGVDAVLTFENGTRKTFRVGTPFNVVVPMNGDQNHDGRVDVSIDFQLDSSFHNTWDHTESAGFMYSGGFGRLRVLDAQGQIYSQRQVGPAFEQFCAPKVGGVVIPLKCYTVHAVDPTAYRPTGFSAPPLFGGLDLSTR